MIPPNATHVTIMWSVCLSVCMSSVALVHPAKAIGWNDMPFGMDTCVVPNNVGKGRFEGRNPGCHPVAKLFWPLSFLSLLYCC